VPENETILYRGENYELGQGPGFYGIWPAGAPRPPSIEWWPDSPEGWQGAWSRFSAIETPGTIVPVGPDPAVLARERRRAVLATALLAAGVACGIAGLFPHYLSGASLAQQPAELVPHVIYFAVWTAAAVLIPFGGVRQRIGALLGLGMSIVTFGLFFADAGTAIAGGAHVMGAGLTLGLLGWLVCAAGSVAAFRLKTAGTLGRPFRPGQRLVPALTLVAIAAVGTAVTFAPSWDSLTLKTATGAVQSVTQGNAFANPAPVIAGDVIVMVTLVAVAVAAALWRPIRLGAVLLAGAIVPMVAQAISAMVQVGEPVSPSQLGISNAQASQAGLTISTGLTPWFWFYCLFVLALIVTCAWLMFSRRPAAAGTTAPPAYAGAGQA
jgi:hypothetical protein